METSVSIFIFLYYQYFLIHLLALGVARPRCLASPRHRSWRKEYYSKTFCTSFWNLQNLFLYYIIIIKISAFNISQNKTTSYVIYYSYIVLYNNNCFSIFYFPISTLSDINNNGLSL